MPEGSRRRRRDARPTAEAQARCRPVPSAAAGTNPTEITGSIEEARLRASGSTKRIARASGRNYAKSLARREGLEPPTPRFEAWCSIRLSYRRAVLSIAVSAA